MEPPGPLGGRPFPWASRSTMPARPPPCPPPKLTKEPGPRLCPMRRYENTVGPRPGWNSPWPTPVTSRTPVQTGNRNPARGLGPIPSPRAPEKPHQWPMTRTPTPRRCGAPSRPGGNKRLAQPSPRTGGGQNRPSRAHGLGVRTLGGCNEFQTENRPHWVTGSLRKPREVEGPQRGPFASTKLALWVGRRAFPRAR